MTYLIAEIGNNHEGDTSVALDMVGKAIEAGVDAVKMQWFNADTLVSKDAPRMHHVIGPGNMEVLDQYHARMRSLELPDETYEQAADICTTADRGFIISPFDIEIAHKANRLATQLKIASGEITNHALLQAVADASLPIFMSTGMADDIEIIDALKVTGPCTIMHCVSIYPTQPWQANLPRIHKLQEKFTQCEIGYSDHTYGDTACIAAAAMGATTIEKHFTLKAFGELGYDIGDHQHSLNPKEMEDLAIKLRKVDNMLRPADGMDKDMRRFLRRGESGLRGDYV